jgi:Lipid A 3-O-deacylase (PagL)
MHCRRAPLVTVFVVFAFAPAAFGQAPPEVRSETPAQSTVIAAADALNFGATEWMATVGTAWSVGLFHSAEGHGYVTQTLSWGKVLGRPKLAGIARGRFEWAVEVMPIYGQYRPQHVYGIGLSPVVWRWNLEPRGRYAPYTELASGLLWTTAPVPLLTGKANFLAHAAAGLRVMITPHQALVLGYRFEHISNGNRLEKNPGVNAHAVHVGWSVLQPRGRKP